jgi:hypothetical protein
MLCGSLPLVFASAAAPRNDRAFSIRIAPPSCATLRGVDPLLKSNNVLLFGEIHGTAEAPAFVADVVCLAGAKRLPTLLAIEWPAEMTPALAGYIGGAGGARAQRALIDHPAWTGVRQDGRRSAAMLQLIERARLLRQSGGDVTIASFSEAVNNSVARDSAMARTLAKIVAANRGRLIVALTGNIHSRLTIGTPFDPSYRPMGFMLEPQLESRSLWGLNMTYETGAAWMCQASCGPTPLKGSTSLSRNTIRTFARPDADGYNALYGVGKITPSAPAAF